MSPQGSGLDGFLIAPTGSVFFCFTCHPALPIWRYPSGDAFDYPQLAVRSG
jgi:hypothetical protein